MKPLVVAFVLLLASALPAAAASPSGQDDGVYHFVDAKRAISGYESLGSQSMEPTQLAPADHQPGGQPAQPEDPRADRTRADRAVEPPPPDGPQWLPVQLPDRVPWAMLRPTGSSEERRIAWYQIRWPAPQLAGASPREAIALYIPRVTALPIEVWIHDGLSWHRTFDNAIGAREQWNRPVLVEVPPDAVAAGHPVIIAVGVPSRERAGYALSSLWVGPRSTLQDRFDARWTLQITLLEAASMTMATLGLLSLGMWGFRRTERAYLYFGIASVVWPVRNLHHFVRMPRDALAYEWFWWMTNASISWVMLAMYFFAFRFHPRRYRRMEWALLTIVAAGSVATIPAGPGIPLLQQHMVNIVTALSVTCFLSVIAVRGGSVEFRVIVLSLWICLAMGVHDWMLLARKISPESIYLLPYGSVVATGSFLYAVLRRYVKAIEAVEAVNQTLEIKLAEREAALEQKHTQLHDIAREQAVLVERQRLMRDMHDSTGATLISTLRLVERGRFGSVEVAELLKAAIDDLRLAIDSLEPIEHDLTTLLATLRLRMERKLAGAQIHLQWVMAELPPLPWLEPPQALHISRLLQEAMANAIKHSGARNLRVSAESAAGRVCVEVSDDGAGFDASSPIQGRGLPSMRHRARALGGRLDLSSAPGQGTVVRLWLPLVPSEPIGRADAGPELRSTPGGIA